MNEQEFYREMIRENAVCDAVVKANVKKLTLQDAAKPQGDTQAKGQRRFPWIAIPATALIAVLTVAVAILCGVSLNRHTEGKAAAPLMTETADSEDAAKVAAFLRENHDVVLEEVLYTGVDAVQTIRLNGLSGLYLLEECTGGILTGVPVDPDAVQGQYDESFLTPYRAGEKTLYARPESWLIYEMPDGNRFYGFIQLAENAARSVLDAVESKEGSNGTEAARELAALTYLKQNGLTATATFVGPDWTGYADADGNVTATVYYRVQVCERDRGEEVPRADTELYVAQLGTVTVNLNTYQTIGRQRVSGTESPVVWGAETVTADQLTFTEEKAIALTRETISTEGLQMTAETDDTWIVPAGIQNLRIRIVPPEQWTEPQKAAFASALTMTVLLDGEPGDWYPNGAFCSVEADGSLLWCAESVVNVSEERLAQVRSVTLIPTLTGIDSVAVYGEDGALLSSLQPNSGKRVMSLPGASALEVANHKTEFLAYAMTLTSEKQIGGPYADSIFVGGTVEANTGSDSKTYPYRVRSASATWYLAADEMTLQTEQVQQNPTVDRVSHYEAACILAYLIDTYGKDTVIRNLGTNPAKIESVYGEPFSEIYRKWTVWNEQKCEELGLRFF